MSAPDAQNQGPERILAGVGDVTRSITTAPDPADAPAWSLETKHALLRRDHPRLDGAAKASGRARYPSDVVVPGLLHAVVLRSTIPSGRVAAIDTSAAEQSPGVAAIEIQTGPGARVRYIGQEILAIAAPTRQAAEDACRRVQVSYETEAHEVAPEDAVRERLEADPLPEKLADTGKQDSTPVVLTHVFETPVQMHHPLEPHGVTCVPEQDGSLTVHASTQGTFGMRGALAQATGLPQNRVRVLTPVMGGGFGGKLSPGVEAALCARLAMKAKRPVRLFIDRDAEATAVGNRPSSIQRIRAGCDAEGRITQWELQSFGFPGYTGSGRVAFPRHYFDGVRVRSDHEDVQGNTGSARAFRAPGHPQGYFACDSMLDELAYRCGIDPLTFRKRNLAKHPVHVRQLEICADEIGWKQHYRTDPRERGGARVLEGVGLGIASWGGLGGRRAGVLCRIQRDGTIEMRNGAQDIGTGTRTLIALVAAETLGVPLERVRVELGDTNDPYGPTSGGSTTAPTLAPAVRHAAWRAGNELAARVAQARGVPREDVTFENGAVHIGDERLEWNAACRLLGAEPVEVQGQRFQNWQGFAGGVAGAQAAHVAVDLDTGLVRVKKIVAVQDCGLVVDKLTAESQVIGAVIQGLSYALFEERITHPAGGQVLNRDFEHFKIAGPAEMPEIVAILQEANNGHNNTGVAGLGEPPTIPTSAAIANAVRNATGVRVFRLPLTPARVFAALDRLEGAR